MSRPRQHLRAPDVTVEVAGSFEPGARNLGDCTKATYPQIWSRYREAYAAVYHEQELRKRHLYWKYLASQV